MKIKNIVLAVFSIVLFFSQNAIAQGTNYVSAKTEQPNSGAITISVNHNRTPAPDSLQINFTYFVPVVYNYDWDSVSKKLNEGEAQWSYNAKGFSFITLPFLTGSFKFWVAEPGDAVTITVNDSGVHFSGKAAPVFDLQKELLDLEKKTFASIEKTRFTDLQKPAQYFQKIERLDNYRQQFTALINSYEGKVSPRMLTFLKERSLNTIASSFKDLFIKLVNIARKDNYKTFTKNDLCVVYDSTIGVKINKWFPYSTDGFEGEWKIFTLSIARKYNFQSVPLVKRFMLYYEMGLQLYRDKPLSREQFLAMFLTEYMIKEVTYGPELKEMLDKYYAELGYPRYKAYVKEYQVKRQKLTAGEKPPQFELTDTKGNNFSSEKLKGKVVLMDFWFTGCVPCMEATPVLQKIENEFKGDTNVVFLSVSADKGKTKWLKSITAKKYTTDCAINLYTNGKGMEDIMLHDFGIKSYPTLFLLDDQFKIIEYPLPGIRKDEGKYVIELIHRQLAEFNDGPYVLHENSELNAYSINSKQISVMPLKKESPGFSVQTDGNKKFTVKLKKELINEKSEYDRPEKLFVLSDIEGNFTAFRKLLQSNKIIDENYNWIFGDGHLIFAGDMFDRGFQVTECLWLIYGLEEKAKAAGGYVHFILGNHEIMNLSGDNRYARPKYKENATRLGKPYAELFNSDSELGRWLRTKNIIEKIGDLLFVHAGISPEVNNLNLSVKQMNDMARPYYNRDSVARKSDDNSLALVYNTANGLSPFWYRLYYLESERKIVGGGNKRDTLYKTPVIEIDKVLENYNVSKIITGHTMVEPQYTLSVHYGNKVINTDTPHAHGISEALLIEGEKFYRVNDKGERRLLFVDDKRKVNGQ